MSKFFLQFGQNGKPREVQVKHESENQNVIFYSTSARV